MFYQGKIFRQFVISMVLVLIFAVISLVITDHFFRLERRKFFEAPAQSLAHKISDSGADPDKAVERFNEATGGSLPFTLRIISEKEASELGPPPQNPFEVVTYYGLWPGKPRITIARLKTPEPRFLEIMPRHVETGRKNYFVTLLLALVISGVLAMLLALAYLHASMKSKAALADGIIEDIKKGNLKARFPIGRADRLSRNMVSFNKMADEIEGLVERLKQTEQARMVLLQQLAHDLRTPIASLKNLLETIHGESDKIDEATREELTALSLKEATYFERLVEDLLFLAQVSEPKYTVEKKETSLSELLEEQSALIGKKYKVKVEKTGFSEGHIYAGDRKLLERLFRNSLENSFSFAKSSCRIDLVRGSGYYEITVYNDGPRMSEDEIAAFGKRRVTRLLNKSREGRVSVGLGSVIMDTIARAHGGFVAVRNADGAVGGVELTIRLAD